MLDAIGSALAAVGEALGLGFAAMAFQADAFERVASGADGLALALIAAYVAGLSQGVGEGVVLLLNRVPPVRFALSLILTATIYVVSALVIAVSAVAFADLIMSRELRFAPTIAVIALAHAPKLLGVLSLAPYFGERFDQVLDVWVLLLGLFGLRYGVGLPVEAAAFLVALGWASARVLRFAFGRPLSALVTRFERAAAGAPLTLTTQNLAESLTEQARGVVQRLGRRK